MQQGSLGMKSRRWHALAIACVLYAAAPTQAAVVSLLASGPASVLVGDTFEVRLNIAGLGIAAGDSLSAFDLAFSFGAGAVSFQGFDFIDVVSGLNELDLTEPGGFGFLGDVDASGAPGTLAAFGLSGNSAAVLDAMQAGTFDFLRLRFRADNAALGTVVALNTTLSTAPFVDSNANLLAVTPGTQRLVFDISAAPTSVPEPTSASLVLLSLLAVAVAGGLRRRATLAATVAACALAAPAVAATEPAAAAPVAAAAKRPVLQGTVVEVAGQRFKVRGADNQARWYTATAALPPQIVNKRVYGAPRAVGDTLAMDQLSFD